MAFANARRASTGLLLGLMLIAAQPLLAAPKIQTWETSQGAKVLFVEAREIPILDLRVVFNAGSARDEGQAGLASLTSAMLTQGAGEWSVDQIAERLEGVGSSCSTGALRDMAWVSSRTLTREPALGITLDTLTAVIGKPNFPAADLERQRKNTLVALSQDQQQPGSVAQKALYRALYGDHPYAGDPSGTLESVPGLTQDQLRNFYQRYYVAKNAVVALVGAIDRTQAEQIAERITSGLAAGAPAPALPPVPDGTGSQQRIPFPSTQAHLYLGQPGMTRTDPDYFPLYVGNHILGGNGLVSLLSEEVREKRGLSYSVSSYFVPMREKGPFILGLQTKNSQAEEAKKVLLDTLNRFRDQGPTAKELEDAKKNITGGFPLRIASNAKIIEYLAVIGFYGLPLDYLDQLTTQVEAVSTGQIRDAFQRRVDPAKFDTILVGPNPPAGAGDAKPAP